MLEDAKRFLEIHLPRPHHIQGLAPEVTPELPTEVLREALVNAVAHRDYTISAPIRVLVFDDRIEIRTPGTLPNTVTLESLPFGIPRATQSDDLQHAASRWARHRRWQRHSAYDSFSSPRNRTRTNIPPGRE